MDPRLQEIAGQLLTLTDASAFSPAKIGAKLLPHVFVLDIERDMGTSRPRLRIRMVGTAIDAVFRRPLQGRHLEEFIHGPRGRDVMTTFHRCAETHEPVWMRQVVHLLAKAPRFVEGVAVYLEPQRLYGGLVVGDVAKTVPESFERMTLSARR